VGCVAAELDQVGDAVADAPPCDTRSDAVDSTDEIVAEGQGQGQLQHRVKVAADEHVGEDQARGLDPMRTSLAPGSGSVSSCTHWMTSGPPKT
jgi:hypothetical protein